MIGIDTNILVRYFAQDDPLQSQAASQLIESLDANNRGFISVTTLVEVIWVLRRTLKMEKSNIVSILRHLMQSHDVVLEQRDVVYSAIALYSTRKADFADCMIACAARQAGCRHTLTFDVGAVKATGMVLLAVENKPFS